MFPYVGCFFFSYSGWSVFNCEVSPLTQDWSQNEDIMTNQKGERTRRIYFFHRWVLCDWLIPVPWELGFQFQWILVPESMHFSPSSFLWSQSEPFLPSQFYKSQWSFKKLSCIFFIPCLKLLIPAHFFCDMYQFNMVSRGLQSLNVVLIIVE